jgi:hypothetical protein
MRMYEGIWRSGLLAFVACGPRTAQVSTAPETTRSLMITNGTAGRVELYLVPVDGQAKLLGELRGGGVTEVQIVVKGQTLPGVSAYLGSGITRTQVPCSAPVESNGKLLVTCGK